MTHALGWCCIPLIAESYDAWGKEAMDSFKILATRLAIISGGGGGGEETVVLSELYGRLNLNLVRAGGTLLKVYQACIQ